MSLGFQSKNDELRNLLVREPEVFLFRLCRISRERLDDIEDGAAGVADVLPECAERTVPERNGDPIEEYLIELTGG